MRFKLLRVRCNTSNPYPRVYACSPAATYCQLSITTSSAENARSIVGRKYVQFMVDGAYTQASVWADRTDYEETITKLYSFAAPPRGLRIFTPQTTDSWGIYKVRGCLRSRGGVSVLLVVQSVSSRTAVDQCKSP